jgi:hypothetical protein
VPGDSFDSVDRLDTVQSELLRNHVSNPDRSKEFFLPKSSKSSLVSTKLPT